MRASPIGDNGGEGGNYSHGSLYKDHKVFGYPLQLHDCKQKAEAMQHEEHAGSACLDDCCYVYIYTYRVYNWQRWSFI